MKISHSTIQFCARPDNYAKVDNFLSRSAQPQKEDFKWLKAQGVTDVFNFRTMYKPALEFEEKDVVEALGMKYHNIPSIAAKPEEKNVYRFLNELSDIKKNGGKAHIHCMAGADRTGMYAFIYKTIKNMDLLAQNLTEWINFGHDRFRYPDLMDWAENFVIRFKK